MKRESFESLDRETLIQIILAQAVTIAVVGQFDLP